jgi:hypothetical protein
MAAPRRPCKSVEQPAPGPGPSARVSNLDLAPGTPYPWRFVAVDTPSGTAFRGEDMTFTSAPKCMSSAFTFNSATYENGAVKVSLTVPNSGIVDGSGEGGGDGAVTLTSTAARSAGTVTVLGGIFTELDHEIKQLHRAVDVTIPITFTGHPSPPATVNMEGGTPAPDCVRPTGAIGDGDPVTQQFDVRL